MPTRTAATSPCRSPDFFAPRSTFWRNLLALPRPNVRLGAVQTGNRASITDASCLADRHSCMVMTS
jgi:hypothetical protein